MIDAMKAASERSTMRTTVETTHNGIQTILAPLEGSQLAAGLLFRVGYADETLATSGITHLVEHLALYKHGASDLHFNGATGEILTHFHTAGSTTDIVDFLNGVSASLQDLPLSRLETEKKVLRVEHSGRGASTASDHAAVRHGANDFGLPLFGELGLANATPESVSAWATRWFNRRNAVLWITSDDVPNGLDLRLPDGDRAALPTATNLLAEIPAWYVGGGTLTYLDAVVPRSTAAGLFSAIFGKRLFRDLRQEAGLCYTATADYAPRDATLARISALADADHDQGEAVATGMLDALTALRLGSIDQSELDAARADALREIETPDREAQRLPAYAMNLLLGHPNLASEQLADELRAVTVEDISEVAEAVWADTLIRTPTGDLSWSGASLVPGRADAPTTGTDYLSLDYDGSAVIVGPEGVSLERSPSRCVTVLYKDVVAALRWPDGARVLIDSAGFAVRIEPTIHPVPEAEMLALDEATPPHLVIQMPAREASDIPQPTPLELTPLLPDPPRRSALVSSRLTSVVLYLLSAFILGAVAVTELQPQTRGHDTGNVIGAAVLGLASLALAYWLPGRE